MFEKNLETNFKRPHNNRKSSKYNRKHQGKANNCLTNGENFRVQLKSEEKSDEQFYSSVETGDEENTENIDVYMEENATDKDPDKMPTVQKLLRKMPL